jgi:hypothetical protein
MVRDISNVRPYVNDEYNTEMRIVAEGTAWEIEHFVFAMGRLLLDKIASSMKDEKS